MGWSRQPGPTTIAGPATITGSLTLKGQGITKDASISGPLQIQESSGQGIGFINSAGSAYTFFVTDAGSATIRQGLTITNGNLILGAASVGIIPGPTSFVITNNANTFANVTISDSGSVTIRNGLSLSGNLNMSSVAGTAALIGGSTGWGVANNANSAFNIQTTDAGAVTLRAGLTVTAGGIKAPLGAFVAADKYVVMAADGTFHVSALGPAS